MAAYPVITPGIQPVEVSTANSSLSYSMLIATLNYTSYKVKRLYMEATSVNQVGTQFRYNTVRPDGNKFVMQNSGNVDPYQFLNVLDVNTENKGLILDNMSTLEFTLEPAGTLEMFFYTDAVYPGMNIDNENEKIEYTMVPSIQKNGKKNNKSWLIVAAALTIIAAVYLYNLEDE